MANGSEDAKKQGLSLTLIAIVIAFAFISIMVTMFRGSGGRPDSGEFADAIINAGRVVVVATDSLPYRVIVNGKIIAGAGDTISQPYGTTMRYTLRPRNGIDFCPTDVTIETPNQRVCIRCDARRGSTQEIRCQ